MSLQAFAIENALPLAAGEVVSISVGGYVYSNYISSQRSWGGFAIGAVIGGVLFPVAAYYGDQAYLSYKLAKAALDKKAADEAFCSTTSPIKAYEFLVAGGRDDDPNIRELMAKMDNEAYSVMHHWQQQAGCANAGGITYTGTSLAK
jgi:hypothetical protein